MLNIKNITIKNFMSVGAIVQAVNLQDHGLTLILGDNVDQGSNGNRNGAGKTVILQAISYALFGQPMTQIKMDNLINKTNKKNMLVTIEFEKNGHNYRIERGRKPNLFKFYVDNNEVNAPDTDEAQGDSRITQTEIERILGFSPLLFKHIIGLSTKTIPFLNERANVQREMIEELLGITQLSEKALVLKEMIKEIKAKIDREEFRIKMLVQQNEKTKQTIEDIRHKSNAWESKHIKNILYLENEINKLMELDIEEEIESHKQLVQYNVLEKDLRDAKRNLDIEQRGYNNLTAEVDKLSNNYNSLLDHRCHACGQEIHDEQHKSMEQVIESELAEACEKLLLQEESLHNARDRHQSKVDGIAALGSKPKVFYDTIDEAYAHKSNLDALISKLEREAEEDNPFTEQIKSLEENNLQEIDYGEINEMTTLKEHQEFLLKLLSDKGSFIRKRIIEQNLGYLNHRLDFYLQKLGLPHQVKFLSDLSVEIVKSGHDFDFDNLSTGESTRLILSLSLAFRDLFESSNYPINLIFIDELIDNGMDSMGGENALAILKHTIREQRKNIFLVSHKDEFVARVSNVLMVTKENDFTTYTFEHDYQL